MSSVPLPQWLIDARRKDDRSATFVEDRTKLPSPGDLWLATTSGGGSLRRYVFVLEIDDELGTASIALVTNVVEAATDRDLVLATEVTALPFEAMIETDVVGPIWVEQLVHLVAAQDTAILDVVVDTDTTSYVSLRGIRRGVPLQGPDDWRLSFKREELGQAHELGADCVRFLLADDLPVCDPLLLMPDRLHDAHPAYLFGLISNRAATLSATTPWTLLPTPGDQTAWASRFGWDGWAAVQLLFQIRDPDETASRGDGGDSFQPARRCPVGGDALRTSLRHWLSADRTSVALATSAKFWDDHPRTSRAYCVYQVGGLRAHVVREMVPST